MHALVTFLLGLAAYWGIGLVLHRLSLSHPMQPFLLRVEHAAAWPLAFVHHLLTALKVLRLDFVAFWKAESLIIHGVTAQERQALIDALKAHRAAEAAAQAQQAAGASPSPN